MSVLFTLYRLRVKVFFGSLKASKVSLLLLVFYSLSMLPVLFALPPLVTAFVQSTPDLTPFMNTVAALLAATLALSLVTTYRGTTAFQYEQDFLFTAPVTPRTFLLAGMLADATALLLFLYPAPMFLVLTVMSLGLSLDAILVVFVSSLLFYLFAALLRSSLSIYSAIHPTLSKIVTTVLIAALLFPSISLFTPVSVTYTGLPFPPTFTAQILLHTLSDTSVSPLPFVGLTVYCLVAVACFFIAAATNYFPFTTVVPLFSAFDTSPKMQTLKADQNIRLFSRVGMKVTLTADSPSLLRFLMKKEIIRILRDGSLFVILLFYVIVSVIAAVGSSRGMPIPLWLFLLALYSLIIPSMLVSTWRVVELKSLWIPLTSGMDFRVFTKALLYTFTLITLLVPNAIIIILTVISGIEPLIPLVLITSVSLIGCSTNLYVTMHFLSERRRATPAMMTMWLSLLLTGVLVSPVYVFIVLHFLWNFRLLITVFLALLFIVYSLLIFTYSSRTISRKAISLEL